MIERLRSRVSELEARLEIDHAYKVVDGEMQRFEIPPEERASFPADGISCRDENWTWRVGRSIPYLPIGWEWQSQLPSRHEDSSPKKD